VPRSRFAAASILAAALFSACSSGDDKATPAVSLPTATATLIPKIDFLPPPSPSPTAPRPSPPANPQGDLANLPWNHDLTLLRSSDGLTFAAPTTVIERAGVPSVIGDRVGRLLAVFQWFPFDNRDAFDQVALSISTDDGKSWTKPEQIVVAGMPAELQRPFDPTIVDLLDGRFRIYFTSGPRGPSIVPAIYSAISDDTIHYRFEPGARFAPPAGTVDASIVQFQGRWHLISHNMQANTGKGYHATSADGLTFEQQPDVDVGVGRQWIGNALVRSANAIRYYGSGRDGIWSATSTDGVAWTLDAGSRTVAGDPSAVQLPNGQTLLIAVGPPRADASQSPFRP
jgi:hypothetical protein